MSDSFFSKTAKFTPTLLKSSAGKVNQFNTTGKSISVNVLDKSSFTKVLQDTIAQSEQSKTHKKKLSLNSIHEVKPGETLTHIALNSMKKAGLKTHAGKIMQAALKIAEFNGIKNPDLIIPGQKIDLSVIKPTTFNAELSREHKKISRFSSLNTGQFAEVNEIAFKRRTTNLKHLSAIKIEDEINLKKNPVLDKTLNRAIDLGYISKIEAIEVKEKIFNMANRFKFRPDDFARVALMESDGFNPKATNGNCYGIIQFCDGNARGAASVGLSHDPEKILELNVPDQLDLVSQYFEDTDLSKFKPASLDQLYLTILSPAARDVPNLNEPLLIQGTQAKALHVGGLHTGPITKSSIVQGLIKHARDTLSNHLFSSLDREPHGQFALNIGKNTNTK